MKAGVIEEILEDTMEGLTEEEDMEDAVQAEVDRIILEITTGKLTEAPSAVKDTLPDPADDDIKEIMLFKLFENYTFKHKTFQVCSIVLVN